MNKRNCNDVQTFYHEWRRLCNSYEDCVGCPVDELELFDICNGCSAIVAKEEIDGLISTVQKWSDDHPYKTRLEDLKEKYPKFVLASSGYPSVAAYGFGYCSNCSDCRLHKSRGGRECWDEPVEGGETGEVD